MRALAATLFLVAALAAAGSASSASASGVRVRLKNEMTHFYVEGYVWFVRIDHGALKRPKHASILLPAAPGRHVVHVFIRACDGNCGLLDPVEKRCAAAVRPGQVATYHLRDDGCKITVSG